VGIIDTLAAGFEGVTRRLELVLAPVLLDILIWKGPRLSINTLSKQALAALPSVPELGSQYQQSMEILRKWLADLGSQANLLSLLSMRALGLPSLVSSLAPKTWSGSKAQHVIEIQSWPELLVLVLLLTALSLLLGCFCLSLIAQAAREERIDLSYVLATTWRSWVRMLGLAFLVSLMATMAIAGMSFLSGVFTLMSPRFAWLVLNLAALGTLWFSIYISIAFYFAPRAIILDNMGILRSLWSSFNIVHRNFLSTVGFILLVNIIQVGLLYIWRALAQNTVGIFIGIIGNAYIGAGLALSSFIFYRDRFVAWQNTVIQAENGERQQ